MKTKYILIFFIVLIISIYSLNFIKSYTQNKIISFLNSDRFNNYIILRLDDILEGLSEGELAESEIDKYSKLLNKIFTKYEPLIKNLSIEK